MKLSSFRAKDEAHLKDPDEAGPITAEIGATLLPDTTGTPAGRARADVRAFGVHASSGCEVARKWTLLLTSQ